MLSHLLLRPVPIFALQALLNRIVFHIQRKHPDLFSRMGENAGKAILIDPQDMPFALLLRPDPAVPDLRVFRSKTPAVDYDARISGSFISLLRMIDGDLDGDALFFSRDLKIGGDTEAVVCLRNAMDDVEGSIAGDVAALHGPPGRAALSFLRYRMRSDDHGA